MRFNDEWLFSTEDSDIFFKLNFRSVCTFVLNLLFMSKIRIFSIYNSNTGSLLI